MAAVRFGLIGAGRWGRVYLRTIGSLADCGRITHLATSRPDAASRLCPSAVIVRDWHQLLASDCDAVIVATPPMTHAEILDACLNVGKPCLVEKPLCLDLATAERLDERVRTSHVPVLVDHTHLFNGAYRALKRLVQERGEPVRLICSEGMDLGPLPRDIPALWDWGPHDLSLCLDLLGEEPQRVRALAGLDSPGGAPERVSLRLDFPGGACAWVQAGRLSPWKRRSLSVFTDRALYVWDDVGPSCLTMATIDFPRRYDGGWPEAVAGTPVEFAPAPQPMERLIRYFVEGLSGGDRRYFGTGMALAITRILTECDAAMKKET